MPLPPLPLTDQTPRAFRSGDALMAFGPDLRVCTWNEQLERLTGLSAADALGRPCWDVLGGVDERGELICHAGCSGARLARRGWPVEPRRLLIRTPSGRRLVRMSTVVLGGASGPTCLHLLSFDEADDERARAVARSSLTQRQLEVLTLIAEGLPAKLIARRLGIVEDTVRNHIRAILLELGCHSQLEALAEARRLKLV